jgi:hypothetical protein
MLNRKALSLAFVALLVPFAGLAADAVALEGGQVQAFAGDGERAATRIFYWDGAANNSPGQFTITYGPANWKAEYDSQFEMLKGKRNRLGANNWPTLETNLPLTIGSQSVAPGIYYIAIECSQEGNFSLVLLDPKEILAKKLDAFQAGQTTGGIIIPLTYAKSDKSAEKLTISLKRGEVDVKKAKLTIAWGNHTATAPIAVAMQS